MQELPFSISAIGTRSGEDERDVLDMMQTEQRNREIVAHALPFDGDRESLDGLGFLYNSNIDVAAATANDHRVGVSVREGARGRECQDVFRHNDFAATGDSRFRQLELRRRDSFERLETFVMGLPMAVIIAKSGGANWQSRSIDPGPYAPISATKKSVLRRSCSRTIRAIPIGVFTLPGVARPLEAFSSTWERMCFVDVLPNEPVIPMTLGANRPSFSCASCQYFF